MLTIKHQFCIHSSQNSWGYNLEYLWYHKATLRNNHSHSHLRTTHSCQLTECADSRKKPEYMYSSEKKCNGSTFRNWKWRLKSRKICLMKMEGGRSRHRLIRPWKELCQHLIRWWRGTLCTSHCINASRRSWDERKSYSQEHVCMSWQYFTA